MLFRAFQPINDQSPVLLEDSESFLQACKHPFGPRGVLTSLFYFPDEVVVAGDVVLAFGNMPISLGQMLAFVHRSRPFPNPPRPPVYCAPFLRAMMRKPCA